MSKFMLPVAAGAAVFATLAATTSPSSWHDIRKHQATLTFAAIAALSSALTAHLAVSSSSSSSSSSSTSKSNSCASSDVGDDDLKSQAGDSGDDADKADHNGKRWGERDEIWSDDQEDWVERKAKKSDDELDATRHLFVVKHRYVPKSQDSEGYYIVQFKSQRIVEVLRGIIKDSEDIFNENGAFMDDKPLFLHNQEIRDALTHLEQVQEGRKASADTKQGSEGDTSADAEKAAQDTDDDPAKAPLLPKDLADGSAVNTDVASDATSAAITGDDATAAVEADDKTTGANTEQDADDEPRADAVTKLDDSELSERIEHVRVLLEWIAEHFSATQKKLDLLLPKGLISFKLLWTLIRPGQLVKMVQKSSQQTMAFQVRRAHVRSTMTGVEYAVSGLYLEFDGDKYTRMSTSETIPAFAGLRKISSLDCSPLSEGDRHQLITRGKLYAGYAGAYYKQFLGALITPGPRPGTYIKRRADGRAMIDIAGYRRMNPGLDIWQYAGDDWSDDDSDYYSDNNGYGSGSSRPPVVADQKVVVSDLKELTQDTHYILLPSTVRGFSFVLSEWGEFVVDSFSDITFDTGAFQHLEMDMDHKQLLKALVESTQKEEAKEKLITDVIAGKGGGIIAVLHGNPGVGKTLTAEAIAELLQRPLYVQGAGELAAQAYELEQKLRDVLEVAKTWGAVVLIDEADVFLEARSQSEVQRNSLVSVFLRALEYQSGILMLTTNRIQHFDPAFISRISVAIRYPDLDQVKRKQVWIKFLLMAGCDVEGATPKAISEPGRITNGASSPKAFISKKQLDAFAAEPLNGRVVKQTVRTAQAISISQHEPLSADHIKRVLAIHKKFAEDFESSAPDYQVNSESWQSRSSLYR